jgi:iron complex transport system permease protein
MRDRETERKRDGEKERKVRSISHSLIPSIPLSPLIWCFLLLFAAIVLSAAIGAVSIPPLDVARMLLNKLPLVQIAPTWLDTYETILFDIRLPRTILILLAGAALSGSGAAYQGLFRNPLADPYIIGVASGAGLGAVIAMSLQWPATVLGALVIPIAAFIGALITVAVVYGLARIGRATPVSTLILAGVAIGSFTTAITTFLMLSSQAELRRAISWMLGGFAFGGWLPVIAIVPYILAGLIALALMGRALNVLQFGDDQAQQLGLRVDRVKLIVVIAASLTTAAAVAFAGIIGFVGLAVPHVIRLLWGGDYRRLIPLSIIAGAAFLLLADILARTIIAPQEVPLGVITAMFGAPFFLWLLRRTKRQPLW